MDFDDEMAAGQAAFEDAAGEPFTYEGKTYWGTAAELNPEQVMLVAGLDTREVMFLDATMRQFAAQGVTPVAKKRLTFRGILWNVRQVTPIAGATWRFQVFRG